MIAFVGSSKQQREHAVPCSACGLRKNRAIPTPKTMTWNTSGLCDRHEAEANDEFFKKIEEARNDFA